MSIFVACLYFFVNNMQSWRNNRQSQIVSSKKSTSVTELLQKNQNVLYEFDPNNYNIYFSMRAVYENGTILNFEQLKKYAVQEVVYKNSTAFDETLPFEKCLNKNKQKFLFQEYDENDNSRSWGVCFEKPYKMGLIASILPAIK